MRGLVIIRLFREMLSGTHRLPKGHDYRRRIAAELVWRRRASGRTAAIRYVANGLEFEGCHCAVCQHRLRGVGYAH